MARFVRLSYEIEPDGPGRPGNPTYRWEQISSIAGGDAANLGVLHLCEDVDLARYPSDARRVYAIPLFPAGADSSPCTVFAEVE